ncbi:MAG TPA: 5-demethoxyubiquinol-8 5-hydroxylase UbiM [Lysobacter sp.]
METQHVDVTIIGAGPAGLCLARALSGQGLRIAVLERQPLAALRTPAFDGREIALTHRSRALMQQLDLWRRLPADEVHPLRDAQVLNGTSPRALRISHRDGGRDTLGFLVPNHCIRAAAFDAVHDAADVTIRGEARIAQVATDDGRACVRLDDGTRIESRLLVAADSRFSETRRALGIGARMQDFGRSMLVCRVRHEVAHDDTAWEWFDHAQTLALLPLGAATPRGHWSSVVLTLPAPRMRAVQALDDAGFAAEIARRFHGRLGALGEVGERHVYPLVGTYAERFVAPRFALVGDAAVGMHPVTAHGFNLGLLGVERLARAVAGAVARGEDIASPALLSGYERGHRRATLPLYLATRAIVGLYTDDRPLARGLRAGLLRASEAASPFKRLLAATLAGEGRGGTATAESAAPC